RAGLLHGIPGLARLRLPRRRRFADDEWACVIDGPWHERIAQAVHQVDDAVLAKLLIALPGLRVDRDEVVAGRYQDRALVGAVGPVGEPAARVWPRRLLIPDALFEVVLPQQLARAGIERDDPALAPRDADELAVRHERRRAEVLVDAELRRDFVLPGDL